MSSSGNILGFPARTAAQNRALLGIGGGSSPPNQEEDEVDDDEEDNPIQAALFTPAVEKRARIRKKRLRNMILDIEERTQDAKEGDLSDDERQEIIKEVIKMYLKAYKNVRDFEKLRGRRFNDRNIPPGTPITLEELDLDAGSLRKKILTKLREGRISPSSIAANEKGGNDPVYNEDGQYIRVGGRGKTRALFDAIGQNGEGKRPARSGDRRAYDHFINTTREARQSGRVLTADDLDDFDAKAVSRSGKVFNSYIRNHVTYVPKNAEKECSFGKYRNDIGEVRCLKNPVHSIPGKSHHKGKYTMEGQPDDQQDDEDGGGGDFGDLGGEDDNNEEGGDEDGPPTTGSRVVGRGANKRPLTQRRSSRLAKLNAAADSAYWNRKSTRRKLNRS